MRELEKELKSLMIEEAKELNIDIRSFIQIGNPLKAEDGRTSICVNFNAFFMEWAKTLPTEYIQTGLERFRGHLGNREEWRAILTAELQRRQNEEMAGFEV